MFRPGLSPAHFPVKGEISPESKTAGSCSSVDIKNMRNYTSTGLGFAVLNYAWGNISSRLFFKILPKFLLQFSTSSYAS